MGFTSVVVVLGVGGCAGGGQCWGVGSAGGGEYLLVQGCSGGLRINVSELRTEISDGVKHSDIVDTL